jgi:hypothetical protein
MDNNQIYSLSGDAPSENSSFFFCFFPGLSVRACNQQGNRANQISHQCGGSGMFIPDPTFSHPGSRIRTVSIPDPGSSSKNLSDLTPKKAKKMVSKLLKNMIRVVHPGSRIRMLTFSHPGSRIQGSKSTQSRIPDPDPQHCIP